MSPVNKHLTIPIPLVERTQCHRSVTLYRCVQFRNVHRKDTVSQVCNTVPLCAVQKCAHKHSMFQIQRAYCEIRPAERKEIAGCITRMTSGYTWILLLQVCQAGNLPVTNIPEWVPNHTTNFMLQVSPWKLVAGYMVNKLRVFITDEGKLPASHSLPRGYILSHFNSVHTPTWFFLTLISTIPTIYLYIGFISPLFSW